MATNFETLGNIIKEEKLHSINKKVLPNTCVLEMEEAFSGYHHELPTDPIPGSVFLITNKFYSREDITRAAQNIRKYAKFDFDAASGQLFIHNDTYSCIRIKDLVAYDSISEIQSNFMNEGIEFCKKEKIDAVGIIKIKKYFFFEEVNENMFLDRLDDKIGYLKIPHQFSWKLFVKIAQNVRNNWDGSHFDAALGSFYKNQEMIDVIRIYNKDMSSDILSKLYILFLREIAHI